MRLIDADLLTEKTKDYFVNPHGALRLVANQPTAFDLESVIAEIEKRRDYYYSEMEKERCMAECYNFDELHNKAMAFDETLEIIKSALNAELDSGG